MAEARTRLLWAAAAVTVVGVIVAARVEDEPEPPARNARRAAAGTAASGIERAARPAGAARASLNDAAPLAIGDMTRSSFDAAVAERIAQAWEPAPPPAPTASERAAQKAALAAKPPPPQAPALPFRVIGRFSDGASSAAIVQSGQAVHVLRRGDVVERNYRVEDVNEKEAILMYLPLNISQKLDLGAAR